MNRLIFCGENGGLWLLNILHTKRYQNHAWQNDIIIDGFVRKCWLIISLCIGQMCGRSVRVVFFLHQRFGHIWVKHLLRCVIHRPEYLKMSIF